MNNPDPASDGATARIDLPARTTSPGWARRHAHAALGAWCLPADIAEIAVLIVSELVTNAVAAVKHASPHSGPIVQTIRREPDRLVIEVSDNEPCPPIPADADTLEESGRGLMLVQALAKEWSYHLTPSGGKTVYCILPIPADLPPHPPAPTSIALTQET